MDISSIFYSAIGGGGGAVFGMLLFSLFQKMRGKDVASKDGVSAGFKGGLVGGLAVAGGLFISSMYKNMTLPRIVPMDDTEIAQSLPVMAFINAENPEAYKKILFPVDRAVRNGGVNQADLDEMRAVLFQLIEEKTEVASGKTLKSAENSSLLQLKILREKAPRICTLMFNGEPFPAIDGFLTEAEIKVEQDVMVKFFTAEPRRPDFVPSLERGKVVLDEALLTPLEDMGILDIRPDVSEVAGNEAEHRKICDLAIAFSKNKLAMDDDDIMNLTAYLDSLQ